MKMNKKLLALAVSAAIAGPSAALAADVTVYGQAQAEVASFSDETSDTTKVPTTDLNYAGKIDGIGMFDRGRGRLGVKASEDLGNGLTGLAKLEYQTDTVGSKAGLFNSRDTWVGLKGGFGQIELGRLKSPYKYAGGVKYDAFVTTTLQARGNGGMRKGDFGANGFVSEMVGYRSPKIANMLTVEATYGPSENDGAWIVSAKVGQKNWEAFVAANDQGDRYTDPNTGDTLDNTAVKFGGMYKMGAHKVMLQYEQVTQVDQDTLVKSKPTYTFLGYNLSMGKIQAVVQGGVYDPDISGTDTATYAALGGFYKFSKTTRAFLGYRTTTDVESVFTIGMRKDFST
jgi:predicted porin